MILCYGFELEKEQLQDCLDQIVLENNDIKDDYGWGIAEHSDTGGLFVWIKNKIKKLVI